MSDTPRYRSLRSYLVGRFGERVHRVTVRGGFTCPNRDGSRGVGGCAFCRVDASAAPQKKGARPVGEQLAEGMQRVARRFGVKKFFAYFNDYSATYAPVEKLERLYTEALADERIVGLAVGTRPDCLPPPVLELLERVGRRTELWVELGLQSASPRSLQRMGRGHTVEEFSKACRRLAERGIRVCAHVILGLPGEGKAEQRATAELIASLPISGLKVHNLHILRGSRWEKMYRQGSIGVPSLEDHARAVAAFLEGTRPQVVIHRLIGDASRRWLVAPAWCRDKNKALARIRAELEAKQTWQGKLVGAALRDVRSPAPPESSRTH